RGRARGRRRAPRVRAPVTAAAETLKQRLAASPTVGLIGLGYVGLPLAVAFAESGANVIGVDLDSRRVAAVRAGISFIEDVAAEPRASSSGATCSWRSRRSGSTRATSAGRSATSPRSSAA